MTGQLLNIAIGLLTTLLGYAIGRVWQRLADRVPYRRAQKIWGRVLAGGLQIVVSRFTSTFDPAGLVGGGDAFALREVTSYFATAGIRNIEIVYADELQSLDRTKNLILLGGPDTNAVTKDALDLIQPGVQIVHPRSGHGQVQDLIADAAPFPSTSNRRPRQRYIAGPELDYGIIVRAPNPFHKHKWLIIIAGAYGYGSWGGAILVSNESFMRECNELSVGDVHPEAPKSLVNSRHRFVKQSLKRFGSAADPVPFECIFKVGVHDGRPDEPDCIFIRKMQNATPGL